MTEEFYKRRSRFYYAFLLSMFDNDRNKLQEALNKFSDKGREMHEKKDKDVTIEITDDSKKKSTSNKKWYYPMGYV